jgi:hypothetical protein
MTRYLKDLDASALPQAVRDEIERRVGLRYPREYLAVQGERVLYLPDDLAPIEPEADE